MVGVHMATACSPALPPATQSPARCVYSHLGCKRTAAPHFTPVASDEPLPSPVRAPMEYTQPAQTATFAAHSAAISAFRSATQQTPVAACTQPGVPVQLQPALACSL
eukprot:8456845-Alexandrium_andersonii.AAC.1